MANNNNISDWEDVPINDWEDLPVEMQPILPEETSSLEAAKTGAFSGISMGFLDELAGALEAGGQAIGIKGLGAPSISEVGLQTPKGFDTKALLEAYQKARDVRREQEKKAAEEAPLSYFAGQVAGGAFTPVPGTGPMTLTRSIGLGAGAGAVSALGQSEESLTTTEGLKETGKEVAAGTLLGGSLGAIVPAIPALAKKGKTFAESQPIIRDLKEIFTRASKGEVLTTTPEMLAKGTTSQQEQAKKLYESGQGALGKIKTALEKQKIELDDAVNKISAAAAKDNRLDDVQPLLDYVDNLPLQTTPEAEKEVKFLRDVVYRLAGKGKWNEVQDQLKEHVAKSNIIKIKKASRLADEIVNLEDEIAKGKAKPEATNELDAMIKKWQEEYSTLRLEELESLYTKEAKDLASIRPFEVKVDPATGVPVGVIETDYKTFAKAKKGLGEASTFKTKEEIRNMIKEINHNDIYNSLTKGNPIEYRQTIAKDLQNMLLKGSDDVTVNQYNQASKKYSDITKLLKSSGLQDFYDYSRNMFSPNASKKMFNTLKQLDNPNSPQRAEYMEFIERLKEIDPELGQRIHADVVEQAKKYELTSLLHSRDPFTDVSISGLLPGGKALLGGFTHGAGEAVYATKQAGKGLKKITNVTTDAAKKAVTYIPSKIMKNIESGNSVALKQMAEKLRSGTDIGSAMSKQTAEQLGNKLIQILSYPSREKQKAAIFALSQQPAYREMFNYLSNEGE